MKFLSTVRIGQISGSNTYPDPLVHDPQGLPLLNDTTKWGALGFDEGANTEHNGRLYIFSGDVKCPPTDTNQIDPFNNSHLVAWTQDTSMSHPEGNGIRLSPVLQNESFWHFGAGAPVGVTLSDEPAAAAFSYGGRVYVFTGVGNPHWSGQTRPGEPGYGLYLVSTDQPNQPVPYRKEFLFNPRIGVCPADGGSHDVLGFQFGLPHDTPEDQPRQSNWFRCRKCSCLFQGETGNGPIPFGPVPQGGVCQAGGVHEANEPNPAAFNYLLSIPYNAAEDPLNQGKWRRCGRCQSMFWSGYSPELGMCPARGKAVKEDTGHQIADQIDYVIPHDQAEDANHEAGWRRCTKCFGLFWDGFWLKGGCPADPPDAQGKRTGPGHDAIGKEPDLKTALQDEVILSSNAGNSSGKASWRLCTKCFGLFFGGNPPSHNVCPVDNQPHTSADIGSLPRLDTRIGYIHPPVLRNFEVPTGDSQDRWHQSGWHLCTKCAILFLGQTFHRPGGGAYADNGNCPAGGAHSPSLDIFFLPHRIRQNSENDKDWRFCTKCFCMVSTKASDKFWTVAAVVVSNKHFPNLPTASGDGLVILGYGWSDFYLAWIPLGEAGPRLQDTLYYTHPTEGQRLGGDPKTTVAWDPHVDNAAGLFGAPNLADATHISLAWLEGPECWLLLYCRAEAPDQSRKGYVIARIGRTLWDWSDEIPIISPDITPELYTMVNPHTYPYGPSILKRFTEWNEPTHELGFYYLISLSTGYQAHVMYTRLRFTL